MFTMKELFLTKLEELSLRLAYDFLYEDEHGELICQIVKRDADGAIMGTPLSMTFEIDEDKGNGEVVYYNSKGEFKKQEFSIEKPETIVEVVVFVQERLSLNLWKSTTN